MIGREQPTNCGAIVRIYGTYKGFKGDFHLCVSAITSEDE
jgi:hypothetical protein